MAYQLGLSLSNTGAAAEETAALQQFYDRLFTPPPPAWSVLYETMIANLIGTGVYQSLDYLSVGTAPNIQTSLTNIISDDFIQYIFLSFGDAPVYDDGIGWHTFNGSEIETGCDPAAGGVKFTRDDCCIFTYLHESSGPDQKVWEQHGGLDKIYLWPIQPTFYKITGAADTNAARPDTSTAGLWYGERSAANAQALYRDGFVINSNSVLSVPLEHGDITFIGSYTHRAWGFGKHLDTQAKRDSLLTELNAFFVGALAL